MNILSKRTIFWKFETNDRLRSNINCFSNYIMKKIHSIRFYFVVSNNKEKMAYSCGSIRCLFRYIWSSRCELIKEYSNFLKHSTAIKTHIGCCKNGRQQTAFVHWFFLMVTQTIPQWIWLPVPSAFILTWPIGALMTHWSTMLRKKLAFMQFN